MVEKRPERGNSLVGGAPERTMDVVLKQGLLLLVIGYRRVISPLFSARCRFYPSCSEYARQALEKYGARRGGWLALRRLVRCGPWSQGGLDPLE